MLQSKLLRFIFHILCSYSYITSIIAIKHHIASVSDDVLLESCGTSLTKRYWKYEGIVLFYNKIMMDNPFGDSVNVLHNFSLAITSVSLEHEGTYECSHGSMSVNHSLEIQVPPHVVLSVNDKVENGTHYLEAGKQISIVCNAFGAKPPVNVTFMINNAFVSPLEIGFELSANQQSNYTFDSVGRFKTQLLEAKGNITCFSGGQAVSKRQTVNLHYQTYKVPVIVLHLNGQQTNDTVYVPENHAIFAECVVKEARPLINITWSIDEKDMDNKNETTTITTNETTETFNAHSAIRFQPSTVKGTIRCVTRLGDTGIVQNAERSFYTFVIPEVFIMINGEDGGNRVHSLQNEEIIASCHATKTRPDIDIEWMVNNVQLDQIIGLYNLEFEHHENNVTTDIASHLRFLTKMTNGNITCVVKGHPAGEISLHAKFQINDANESATQPTYKVMGSLVIYLVVPTSVFLFSLACYFIKKALHVSGQSNLSRDQECSSTVPCSADDYKLKEYQLQRSSSHVERKESLENTMNINETVEYERPPQLELPELPKEIVDPGYTHITKNEAGYCTVLGEITTKSKLFYEKDLCLILSMKTGELYNRWMGSINMSDEISKCVVISTVSDIVLKSKSFNWNGFVKRVLELPDNINLTKVEGICIDSVHLYLLHEHLICGTLDVRVKEKEDEDVPEVMRYISGILEGMELLHSYGFLHPGLSTKKILLTKEGICKLYDFCLSENAASVVNLKKKSINCSVNQFAPEALLRNEYTQAADVWSVAVVIWEIITRGCPPFCIDGQTTISDRISVAPETWPEMYQQLRNNRLIDCWNRDFSLRPTINELRNSIRELSEEWGSQTLNEDRLKTTSDLYVPMTDSKDVDQGLRE